MSKHNQIDEVAQRYDQSNESKFSGGEDYSDDVISALNNTGQYTEKVNILEIWPDLKQPRRAVPMMVRGRWDGNPDFTEEVLGIWRDMVLSQVDIELNESQMIMGSLSWPEYDEKDYPLVATYVELIGLATSIYQRGLEHPISVTDSYRIIAGERRWLAHHLLVMYTDDPSYKKIPARVRPYSVWAQAEENTQRSQLNAIAKARQLALLLMDMWNGEDGVKFDPYEAIVLDGESDLPYYAQVADGNIYRIKRGMGEKIQNAMNFSSKQQVGQYRALLRIPDEIWIQADAENWTEFRIREYVKPEPKTAHTSTSVDISQEGDRSTVVDLSERETVDSLPDRELDTVPFSVGDKVKDGMGRVYTVMSVHDVSVNLMSSDFKRSSRHYKDLSVYVEPKTPDWMREDYEASQLLPDNPQGNDGELPPPLTPPQSIREGNDSDDYLSTPDKSHSMERDMVLSEAWAADKVLDILMQLAKYLDHRGSQNPLHIMRTMTLADVKRGAENGNQEVLVEMLDAYKDDVADLFNVATMYIDEFLLAWEQQDNEVRGDS